MVVVVMVRSIGPRVMLHHPKKGPPRQGWCSDMMPHQRAHFPLKIIYYLSSLLEGLEVSF